MDSSCFDYRLPETWRYTEFEEDVDSCTFRVKEIQEKEAALTWKKEFSDLNLLTWRVAKTYPKAGKYNEWREDFRCQHKTDKRALGVRSSKNTDCPAQLLLVIKRYNPDSKSKKYDALTKEYPAVITFRYKHNHMLDSAAALKYRDLDSEIEQKFIRLFQQGHNASSALYSHKVDLILQYPNNYYEVAADGKFMPSLSVVYKLFKKEFEGHYGSISGDKMFDNINIFLQNYEVETGGIAKLFHTQCQQHYFIIICSPLMLRVHQKVRQSGELVLLDASGGCDKQRHRIYFMVTPTAAGGLPLGVIITDSEKESVFSEALSRMKESIGSIAFFSQQEPTVFLTDNDLKEINALNTVFPNSKKLLCQFHMLKAFWAWLCDRSHGISIQNRQEAYFLFKSILYSFDEATMELKFSNLKQFAHNHNYGKLEYHIDALYCSRKTWVSCYRNDLPLRGNNTTNYVEVVFKIFKDCILDRLMAFNLTQLVDFILTRYELYMRQRLTDFCNGRYQDSLLRKMLPYKIDSNDFQIVEEENNTGTYKVVEVTRREEFFVEIDKGVCTCFVGKSGRICKHSSAVLLTVKETLSTSLNIYNEKTRQDMFYIAQGSSPPQNWFCPLQKLPINENDAENGNSAQELQMDESTDNNSALPVSTNRKLNQEHISHSEVVYGTNNLQEQMKVTEDPCHVTRDIDNTLKLSQGEEEQLQNMFQRITNCIQTNPSVFVPAARKMLRCLKLYAKTDTGLASAMHTFGFYNGVTIKKSSKTFKRLCHRSDIGIQPTSRDRRASKLPGKRRICAGRVAGQPAKPKMEHIYTSFGVLPSRKRKAPHNLQTCVYDNKSLGGTKHAK